MNPIFCIFSSLRARVLSLSHGLLCEYTSHIHIFVSFAVKSEERKRSVSSRPKRRSLIFVSIFNGTPTRRRKKIPFERNHFSISFARVLSKKKAFFPRTLVVWIWYLLLWKFYRWWKENNKKNRIDRTPWTLIVKTCGHFRRRRKK